MLRGVVEPGDEIEGFPEIAAMMQSARDRGEITQTDRRVARDVLENPAAFVLRQIPPQRALLDRDERRAAGADPAECRLDGRQALLFIARGVAEIAGRAAQGPTCARGQGFEAGVDDLDPPGGIESFAPHRRHARHLPRPERAADEGVVVAHFAARCRGARPCAPTVAGPGPSMRVPAPITASRPVRRDGAHDRCRAGAAG